MIFKKWLQTEMFYPVDHIFLLYTGSIAMSFLEIGGLFGSVVSGYVTDKLVRKVWCY